jgi:hypothetical protein
MGHKAEESATGKRYIHRRPQHLRGVIDGVDAPFRALSEFVEPLFKRLEWTDQPPPDDPFSGLLRANPARARLQLVEFGAGNETRTRDPDLGKVVLYQLSYSRVALTRSAKFYVRPLGSQGEFSGMDLRWAASEYVLNSTINSRLTTLLHV